MIVRKPRHLRRRRVVASLTLVALAVAACSGSGSASEGPASTVPVVVDIAVGDDAAALVSASPPGTTFHFLAGVHRGVAVEAEDGDVFTAEERAVLSGAVEVDGFAPAGRTWAAAAPVRPSGPSGQCRLDHPACGYPEELFVDGEAQGRVLERSQVVAGSWLFDEASGELVLGTDPTGRVVELSVTPVGITGNADDVTIDGLDFVNYANAAQAGVVQMGSEAERWHLSSCSVSDSHGVGAVVRSESTVEGCRFEGNGQQGLGGDGHGVRVEGNVLARNNRAGFDPGWSAGGAKFAFSVGLRLVGNTVTDNDGPGLWCDIDCDQVVYDGNDVQRNAGAGIFHEISYAAEITGNTVIGNGFDSPGWVIGAGIQVSASADVIVTRNHVEGNRQGIIGLEQSRGSGARGPWLLQRLTVLDNTVKDSGQTGIAQDYGNVAVYDQGHVFDRNHYLGQVSWSWRDGERGWDEWRSFGHDAAGTYRAT